MLHKSLFFDNFGNLLRKYPNVKLTDLFSKGQIESKRWLVNTLLDIDKPLGTVFICAGWYGSLATFLFENNLKIEKIRSFDIDETCADIADTFNRSWVMDGWRFKASTLDILEMDFPTTYTTYRANGTGIELTEMPDTVINTSCEHIKDFENWYSKIPFGKLIVLQSNNFYEVEEHVNCVNSIEDFETLAPVSTLIYAGELELEKYSRYMIIGYR